VIWTEAAVRDVCRVRSEDVLVDRPAPRGGGGVTAASMRRWRTFQHIQRLAWQHGPGLAARVANGLDDATRADLAAWYALGRRSAA